MNCLSSNAGWILIVCSFTVVSATPWVFLVTGSNTWDNYRHHADIAHAYHHISHSVPTNRIVSFQFNDVPTLEENPYQGTLFNQPSGKAQGVDVNHNFNRSYTGSSVNKRNILHALTCNTTDETLPCLRSTAQDNVFFNWAGHGSGGMLMMPSMRSQDALYADELLDALKSIQFRKMVIYIEACESGSMMTHLPSDIGVYAVTAASASENSYPIYCCSYFHDQCMVHGQDIGACLGDMFSVAWLEAATPTQTLKQSFVNAKAKTAAVGGNPGSTVSVFGDQSFTSEPLSQFIGSGPVNHSSMQPISQETHERASSPGPFAAAVNALAAELTEQLAELLAPSDVVLQLSQFECYRELNNLVDELCAPTLAGGEVNFGALFPEYHQQFYKLSRRVCARGQSQEAVRIITNTC